MLRTPTALLIMLAPLTACTTADSAPGDILAVASSSSTGASTSDAVPTTTSTDGPVPDDTTADATTSAGSTAVDASTASSVGSTTDATTGDPLRCGDGVVDPGEACDDGHLGNADDGACTLACEKASCGDHLVWAGHEECDEGDENFGLYGGCRPDCTLADHCGDGAVNGPEQCDLGPDNGPGEHLIDAVPCSPTCYHEALTVFLSSTPFAPSQLASAVGADQRCQALAEAAGLYGGSPFKAWLSDDFSDPDLRFLPAVPGMPYALLSGKRIAKDRAALLATGPEDGITMTETGATIYKAYVWTATNPDGTGLPDDDCDTWDTDSALWKGGVGVSGVDKQDMAAWQTWKSQQHWSTFAALGCHKTYRLYCVEQ